MTILEQNWLTHIRRPSRYMGNEINAIRKDPVSVEVSVALAFPDVYEVGMSHLGLKILYNILNSHEWLAAERAFSPWSDMEKELRERGIPLTTLESQRPLSSFDILGFSLQHELSFTNVLNMLDLSGIPFLSAERDDSFPLIIAGGPASFNPEPVADLFDVILIGDGEAAAMDLCNIVREAKLNNLRRDELFHQLTKVRGIYLPHLFKVHYKPDGTINLIEPLIEGYKEVRKAVISDIDQYPFPTDQVVPFTPLIHDRLVIEISRGCTRGCRFCQAGMIYRPVRERNPNSIIKNADKALRFTGFEEISLLSLSSGDYGCIAPLLKELMDQQSDDKIAISLPSLRIDGLDPFLLEQIKRVRKTGFTMAPEAGNDRLRSIINKPLTNAELLSMTREVYGAGWNLMKLYFMIGLPSEEDKDLQDIINLAKDVAALAKGGGKKAKLNVSISTFVPKSHTPFMWVQQITLEESRRRIRMIRDGLRGSRVRVKWNQPELSWLEGIFSRGDRRLTPPLIEAWRKGARFDAWADHFSMDIWKGAFEKSGIDPDFYLYRSRLLDEILPWDHISSGVTKEYLKKEWKRAFEEKTTQDCRIKCHECGVCDHKEIDMISYKKWGSARKNREPFSINRSTDIKKYRIIFSKTEDARYLSHLELARVFIRALKRAGLCIAFSKGFHPMPKVSFTSALPVGTESIHETMGIELYETIPISKVKEAINRQLPHGVKIISVEDITGERKRPSLVESHFRIDMNGIEIDRTDLENFLKSDYVPIIKRGKKGEQVINARPFVKSMDLTRPYSLDLVIKHLPGPSLRPIDIINGIFRLNDHHVEMIKILKTKQVMV